MALTPEPEHLFDQRDRVFTGTLVIKGEPKPIGAEIKQFAESVEHLGTVFGGHTAVDSGIDDESAAMSFFNGFREFCLIEDCARLESVDAAAQVQEVDARGDIQIQLTRAEIFADERLWPPAPGDHGSIADFGADQSQI